jgi:hypothetical protein
MGLKNFQYTSLGELLASETLAAEDLPAAKIVKRLRHVAEDRELSRGEFLDICQWKSPRSIRQCERNAARTVEEVSRKVFATGSEKRRVELLTNLRGVSIPTASAILALSDPQNYGIIDIRVWQLLFSLKSVRENPRGQNFTFAQWYHFLKILRYHAERLDCPVRNVELTLFKFHQRFQKGTLYGDTSRV